MARSEHANPVQFHGVWEADKQAGPLEGTERHPQGRLFAPVGAYRGDPFKLTPENWLGHSATPAHSDTIAWHSSESSALPRYDSPESRQIESEYGSAWDDDDEDEEREDFSEDTKERPMAEYGSAIGLHLGNIKAATARDDSRPFVHPARIPEATMEGPKEGASFRTERRHGQLVAGPEQSSAMDYSKPGHEEGVRDTRWSDEAANYAERATDLVEEGKTLPYRNEVEAAGSTSFRTKPDTVRTWSEDVMNARSPRTGAPAGSGTEVDWQDEHAFRNEPHPSLVHLAQQGYNPVVQPAKEKPKDVGYLQPQLLAPEGHEAFTANMTRNMTRTEHFHAGRTATLQKAKDEDYDW